MSISRNLIRKRSVPFDQRHTPVDRGFLSLCFEWQGNVANTGYGRYGEAGKMWLAHRYAYVQARGPIPNGLSIDHLCRNQLCVNPDHLEAVSLAENTRRQMAAKVRATHCFRGHFKDGKRGCPVCAVATRARHRIKLLEAFGTSVKPGGFGIAASARIDQQRAHRAEVAKVVVDLYQQGVHTPEIAAVIGRKDRSAVFHYLKVAGVVPNRDPRWHSGEADLLSDFDND